MTKTEVLSKLKKPFATFLVSLIVCIVSIISMKYATVNAVYDSTTAEAATTTAASEDTEDTTQSSNNDSLVNNLLNVNDNNGTLELVMLITILSLAPSILIMMTSFVRIVIVFSLLRSALGTQQTPPNQVLVGLAVFLTLFIMAPVVKEINTVAYQPYKAGEYTAVEAVKEASVPLKEFMLKNTSNNSMSFFLDISGTKMPESEPEKNLGIEIVVPAFVLSELKRAFIIGFLLFIPFLIIDIVVASVLMSMGMIMLPPSTISLPFKILLFILVDGWQLLAGTLIAGFN